MNNPTIKIEPEIIVVEDESTAGSDTHSEVDLCTDDETVHSDDSDDDDYSAPASLVALEATEAGGSDYEGDYSDTGS